MTNNEVYQLGKKMLLNAHIDDASTEAIYLFYNCFKLDRQALILNANSIAEEEKVNLYFSMIEKRTTGIPLQYILGEWEFMDIKFKVGHGVLIPREDTRVLIDALYPYIKRLAEPKILDLCAGSGTIAIKLAKLFPKSQVFAVELSDEALKYLRYNIDLNDAKNISVIKSDILRAPEDSLFPNFNIDVIVSNPPYIRTQEIGQLQREVQFEPTVALDGGEDGLNFYRAIADHWIKFLKPSGALIAVEIGSDQAEEVSDLFLKRGLTQVAVFKDLSDLDRACVFKNI